MEEFEITCCIWGYHVYKEIWEAAVGEELVCAREPHNSHDRYAVAVKREDVLIWHLPRKLSRLCSLFLRWGGAIFYVVTGGRKYSVDLPQGSLEVPCTLLLKHKPKEVEKLTVAFSCMDVCYCEFETLATSFWQLHCIEVSYWEC